MGVMELPVSEDRPVAPMLSELWERYVMNGVTVEDWETVRRGHIADSAAVLDEHKPGWYKKVDLDTLDMESPYSCVLGQVFRSRFFRRDSGYIKGCAFLFSRGYHDQRATFCSSSDHKYWEYEIIRRHTN